jgi:acetyl-CoA synthetase
LKKNADEALETSPSVRAVVVYRPHRRRRRGGRKVVTIGGTTSSNSKGLTRDVSRASRWTPRISSTCSTRAAPRRRPKGIVHTTAGYLVGTSSTHHYIFDLKPEKDVYWCAADVGWVTGHSYIVYGPLCNGTTSVLYEGTPDFPNQERWWEIVERYGVTVLYTAPTAIRAHMKWGPEHAQKHDLSSLRLLGSVGEPINPEAWVWYREHIGADRTPVGRHVVADRDRDDPDHAAAGCDDAQARLGDPAVPRRGRRGLRRAGERGAARRRGLSRPPQAVAGDAARDLQRPRPLRPDVLVALRRASTSPATGRGSTRTATSGCSAASTDVMNVSGHRISTIEVESALVDHPTVAEGRGLRTERPGHRPGDRRVRDAQGRPGGLGRSDGGAAEPRRAEDRPDREAGERRLHAGAAKTRSGKIMRRLLRDVAEHRPLGDTTTLADPTVVEEIEAAPPPRSRTSRAARR